MADYVSEELSEFFHYMWREDRSFVYLPFKEDKKWYPRMFDWPRQERGVIRHCLERSALGSDVYHCPATFSVARPIKENVKQSWFLWADMDGNAPKSWPIMEGEHVLIPKPSLLIQSSIEGHEHAYWELDEPITNISVLEDRNRAIAYALQADTSGWDADQVLRPPHTRNTKRDRTVSILDWDE